VDDARDVHMIIPSPSTNSSFSIRLFKAGTVYQAGLETIILVTHLDTIHHVASGYLVNADGSTDTDIRLQIPISKLTPSQTFVNPATKKLAKNVYENAFKCTQSNLTDPKFQKSYRENTIMSLILAELAKCLASSSHTPRRLDLGTFDILNDFDLLKVSPFGKRISTFSYAKTNFQLGYFDQYLGNCWDILQVSEGTRYIVSIRFTLRSNLTFTVSMARGLFPNTLDISTYREMLSEHVQSTEDPWVNDNVDQ